MVLEPDALLRAALMAEAADEDLPARVAVADRTTIAALSEWTDAVPFAGMPVVFSRDVPQGFIRFVYDDGSVLDFPIR